MFDVDPDRLDRVVKLVADADPTLTFADAAALLRTYRLVVRADALECADAAWQAALLTAVNVGVRAVHGGVRAVLGDDPVCVVPWAHGRPLSEAVRDLGAEVVVGDASTPDDTGAPQVVLGASACTPARAGSPPVVRAVAGTWVAKVQPAGSPEGPLAAEASVLAAVLASAMAVSECFQWLCGYAVAGDRVVRVSLWDPEGGAEGPKLTALPKDLWLLGLGHLGQAYAWLLALLPYPAAGTGTIVLQDDDRLSAANRATSMLHRDELVVARIRKTRLVAGVLEPLGWDAAMVERRYSGGPLRTGENPQVLLGGVDNVSARRQLDDTGFPLIYDAGLGAGPDGYLGVTIRRLPGARPSRDIWSAEAPATAGAAAIDGAAYRALEAATKDRCGVEQLAGRTVATAFVGTTAACWVIGGLLRELHGGLALALVDYTLRDPGRIVTVSDAGAHAPRLATVPLAA